MAGAFAWGLLAASSLVLGAAISLCVQIGLRTIGLIMGFGAGVLISAVAFDLVGEAVAVTTGHGAVLLGLFAGCGVFFGGDWLIDRAGGAARKSAGRGDRSSALAIVLGTILDGIPESIVIGLTIFESGSVGAAYLRARRSPCRCRDDARLRRRIHDRPTRLSALQFGAPGLAQAARSWQSRAT